MSKEGVVACCYGGEWVGLLRVNSMHQCLRRVGVMLV